MRIIDKLSCALSLPAAYRLFSRLVGAQKSWRIYMADYVKPAVGEIVLDIGCGPAEILNYLPKVDYTGLDISPEYILSAQKRFEGKGRFFCTDVGMATIEREQATFNLVLATGVVHHLDDERAKKLFTLARLALRPGGRLITYDGCYVPEQSGIARWLLSKDRGKFVRRPEDYIGLASKCFSKVEPNVRHDLLHMPYTHLILRCSN